MLSYPSDYLRAGRRSAFILRNYRWLKTGQRWENRLSAESSYLHRLIRLTQKKQKARGGPEKGACGGPPPRSTRRKIEARTEGAQAAPVVYDGPESSDLSPRRAEPGHYGGEAGANSRWDRDGAVART